MAKRKLSEFTNEDWAAEFAAKTVDQLDKLSDLLTEAREKVFIAEERDWVEIGAGDDGWAMTVYKEVGEIKGLECLAVPFSVWVTCTDWSQVVDRSTPHGWKKIPAHCIEKVETNMEYGSQYQWVWDLGLMDRYRDMETRTEYDLTSIEFYYNGSRPKQPTRCRARVYVYAFPDTKSTHRLYENGDLQTIDQVPLSGKKYITFEHNQEEGQEPDEADEPSET